MRTIEEWMSVFPKVNPIYPKGVFYNSRDGKHIPNMKTPYQVIKRETFKNAPRYFNTIEDLISLQDEKTTRRGADLPFFGEKYFAKDDNSIRTMVITQDSQAKDAGSIVFLAPLLAIPYTAPEYLSIHKRCRDYLSPNQFTSKSYSEVKSTFMDWGVNLDYLYITDSRKVYQCDSNSFDERLSQQLLRKEIEMTKPDIIILAGDVAFCFAETISDVKVGTDCGSVVFKINNATVVRAPFFTGRGRMSAVFKQKYNKTEDTLKNLYKEMNIKIIS